MKDSLIVALFLSRSERAIKETAEKYGKYCHTIAYNILYNNLDAEECVSDTYMSVWSSVPPQKPKDLRAYCGCITRNNALNRYHSQIAIKRRANTEAVSEEFYECLPAKQGNVESDLVFKDVMNRFLKSLDKKTRIIFMRRYWYFCSIEEIAEGLNMSESSIKTSLHRTRNKLKDYLVKEGLYL